MLIPKITDVYVSIDITHPQISKDLKKIAIFTKGDQQSFKTYTYLPDVMADFDENTETYKTAEAIFSQDDAPEAIQIITYADKVPAPVIQSNTSNAGTTVVDNNASNTSQPSAGIGRAAFDYFYEDWEIAILADYNKADALALADVLENGGYDGKGFHFMFQQFGPSNAGDGADFDKYSRTWKFYHSAEDEKYTAALASEGTSDDAGKVSWKFVHDLNGITPEKLTATELLNLKRQHFITYVQKADHASQIDDSNAQGLFVDFIHGLDFVKATVESNLQNALTLDGKQVFSYTQKGLNAIKVNIETTLDKAGNQGIIDIDSTGKYKRHVDVPDIDKIHASTVSHRILQGVKFEYTSSSAINEVHINGNAVA
ncbi:DUF3383 domain-containing protein [Apilactobacillus xinyiensis]|uniref:DUF3383 domain-containing protein n=1 Tax=Apilactobacillus xinyiensis TaxID=2841032 RepID=UPI00200D6A54|nr:DUF3383 domain-containing protein [Apilactobacillus xinyiensis]MCL0330529.1 DUF3383 domain-containing protein [Apilactobacillus xinyiensis]